MVVGNRRLCLSKGLGLLLQFLVDSQRLRVRVLRSLPTLALLSEQMLVVPQDPLIFAVPVAPSLRAVGAARSISRAVVADALL